MEPNRILFRELSLNRQRHEVRVGSQSVGLTRKEFALLWTLASEPGRVFHRDELLVLIWGSRVSVEARTIDAHMTRVRRKLLAFSAVYKIDTVWGIGYRLRDKI